MQLIIEPTIRSKVEELNALGRIIRRANPDPNARLRYHSDHPLTGETPISLRIPDRRRGMLKFKGFDLLGRKVDSKEAPLSTWHTETTANYEGHVTSTHMAIEAERMLTDLFGGKAVNTPTLEDLIMDQMHDSVIAELNPQKGHVVIELGPGEGELLESILQRGSKVIAIDHSRQIIAGIKRRFAQHMREGRLEVKEMQYTEIPSSPEWRHGQADRVVSTFSTELHPHPAVLFRMIKAALKKGGTYTIAEMTPFHRELTDHLKNAGLVVEKVQVHAIPLTFPGGPHITSYYTIITCRKP